MTQDTPLPPEQIRRSFAELRSAKRMRHLEIAQTLGISEGALMAAHAGAAAHDELNRLQAIRLQNKWPDIVATLESLGEVMALTRNPSCVHEKTGTYAHITRNGHIGLVQSGAIDLRIFYAQWQHGFAVMEENEAGPQRSLQFFDASGRAVHKVFLKAHSDVAAYEQLVAQWQAPDQDPAFQTQAPAPEPEVLADAAIDAVGFLDEWGQLRDTHDFFGLLKRHKVSRIQAMRLAQGRFVRPVARSSVLQLLNLAVQHQTPLMVFVGNPGVIQIHTGPIHKVAVMGPWVNVLDPDFNLHLREDQIDSAWIVRKPADDDSVHSLEVFDASGNTIAMFFGARKPGIPESRDWRALLTQIQEEHAPCLT
nr:ChuX/HutX family heme-like substrate-binding protein [uncultured Rhodoferax sp.]